MDATSGMKLNEMTKDDGEDFILIDYASMVEEDVAMRRWMDYTLDLVGDPTSLEHFLFKSLQNLLNKDEKSDSPSWERSESRCQPCWEYIWILGWLNEREITILKSILLGI